MFRRLLRTAVTAITISTPLAAAFSAPAGSANPLSSLAGSWRGSGTVRFEGGQSESLTCRGFYTIKNGGTGIGLALRCASTSAKIELRSLLNYQGGRVSGSWEERTFNSAGNVHGRASNGRLSLAISGGVSGSMLVMFGGASQSISINTSGTGLKGVSVSLKRA